MNFDFAEQLEHTLKTLNFSEATGIAEAARDWCEQLIIARFMELMRAAHLEAARRGLAWAKLPLYFTEHAYDFVVKSGAVSAP
jgi:hypothetical protein